MAASTKLGLGLKAERVLIIAWWTTAVRRGIHTVLTELKKQPFKQNPVQKGKQM